MASDHTRVRYQQHLAGNPPQRHVPNANEVRGWSNGTHLVLAREYGNQTGYEKYGDEPVRAVRANMIDLTAEVTRTWPR